MIVAIAIAILAWIAKQYFGVALSMSPSIWFGLLGAFIVFIGNGITTEAVTRWGAKKMRAYRIGNYIQVIGFFLTLLALLIK